MASSTQRIEKTVQDLRARDDVLRASGRKGRISVAFDFHGAHLDTLQFVKDRGFEILAIDFDEHKAHFEIED